MVATCALFTVGKVDAGMAILLTEDNHLIEFPSLLLPNGVSSGAIVKIEVSRDVQTETKKLDSFINLQKEILAQYGTNLPKSPKISLSSVTQNSVVIEWEKLELFNVNLHQFQIFKDGAVQPNNLPKTENKVKLSGLSDDTQYDFQIKLVTSAGTFISNSLTVRTLAMNNLSSINVTLDNSLSQLEMEELKKCVQRIGASYSTEVTIDTTDLLAHRPQQETLDLAVKFNVPCVRSDWLKACEALGKIQPALAYYVELNGKK